MLSLCRRLLELGLAAGPVLVLAACAAGPGAGRGPSAQPDFCRIAASGQSPRADTVIVALTDPVSFERAPLPANDSETLIFRQLYATLVREDCAGQLSSGLADRWLRGRGGMEWSFELRPGLRFGDGTRLDAAAVQDAWERMGGAGRLRALGVASTEVLGPRLLRVQLTYALATPRLFADPALAAAGPRSPNGRPAESGAFRLGGPADSGGFDLVPEREGVPLFRVRFLPPGADLRDVLDQGAGGVSPPVMAVTHDQRTLAYARRTGSFQVVPLPWTRVYAFLSAPSPSAPPIPPAPHRLREELAHDAVSSEARGASDGFMTDSSCTSRGALRGSAEAVIAYPAADQTARSLAERILVLASSSDPGQWPWSAQSAAPGLIPWTRTLGLDSAAFRRSLSEAGATAFVAAYPSRPLVGCRGTPLAAGGYTVIPLIETRAHVVLPVGASPFAIDGDGTLRLDPAGWP